MNIPIYELFVEDSDDIGLALVDRPAIEKDFMFFNDEPVKMQFNDEKRMVKGPALVPNQLIYRNDALGERYIYFSEDTILKFVEKLMSKDKNKFNLGHTDNYLNATLIESYFAVEDNDFNVPAGSWIVGLKIQDADAWQRIKSGEFKGFSVQSLFSNELVNLMSNKQTEMSDLKTRISEALNKVLFPTEEVALEEEVIDEPVEVVEDTPSDEVVIDEAFIDAKIAAIKEEIMLEVANMLIGVEEGFSKQFKEVETKVEEFGAQPVEQSVTEEVTIPKVDKSSKAAQFFSK